jgi:hypothetical protein
MRSGWVTARTMPAMALARTWRDAKPTTAAAIALEASTVRGQAVQARELRQGEGDADDDDRRLDHAAQEAQARVEHRAELGAAQRIGQLVAAPTHRAVHDRHEHQRREERQCGGDQAPRRRVGCDDEGRHGA